MELKTFFAHIEAAISSLFDSQNHLFGGFAMAIIISILRVIYDQEETRCSRIFMESAICGCLSLASGSAMSALGYGDDWYLFFGGVIGFLGSHYIRQIAHKVITKAITR